MVWFLQQTKLCCMPIIKLLSMSRLKMFSYFDENQQLTRIEIRWQYSHKTGPNCEEKHDAGHKSSPREQTQWDASKIYATDLSPLSPTLYLPVLGIRYQNKNKECMDNFLFITGAVRRVVRLEHQGWRSWCCLASSHCWDPKERASLLGSDQIVHHIIRAVKYVLLLVIISMLLTVT